MLDPTFTLQPPSCPELWRQGNVLPQGAGFDKPLREMVGKNPMAFPPLKLNKSPLEKEAI